MGMGASTSTEGARITMVEGWPSHGGAAAAAVRLS